MKAAFGHTVYIACLMSIFSGVMCGCTIGGKSFSIDSNSRVPFFGLELKERKPKRTVPSYQSISQTNRDKSDVKIALPVGPSSPISGLKKRDNRLVATSLPDQLPLSSTPSKGVASTTRDAKAISIPLPRTDVDEPRVGQQRRSSSAADFQ